MQARLWQEKARRTPTDALAWRMARCRIGGLLPLDLPPLRAILRHRHPRLVIQKAAQVRLTEAMVHLALWGADSGVADRGHVLYLMPTAGQMRDFTQARVDRAIQDSACLRGRLLPEPPRRKGADSTRLKRVGDGYVFLRGSDSWRQVTSIDADLVLLDEYDQMGDQVLTLAEKRLTSSRAGQLIVASTPRYPEAGIHALCLASDRRRY